MTEESMSEMTFTMLSLLFLLLGVVLIASIIMSTINPYEQITFANTEKLRASIEQACGTTGELTINLDLPQNTPAMTSIFTVMPIWIISTNGDPNYLLYYESFPVGEATGWEVYQTMQNRLVTYLPDGHEDDNAEDVINYVEEVVEKTRSKQIGSIEGVIINNIILDSKYRSDFYMGESPAASGGSGPTSSSEAWRQTEELLKNYGEWRDTDQRTNEVSEGDNFFKFNNYAALSTFEKAAIKYPPCGDNSLCLKTRDGVYRFPLTQCNDIKAIHIIYKALGDDEALQERMETIFDIAPAATGVGFFNGFLSVFSWFKTMATRVGILMWGTVAWTIGDLTTNMIERHIAFKVSDFNVASPCSIDSAVIKKVPCRSAQPAIEGYIDTEFLVCESVQTYPLYRYNADGKLVKAGTRDACIESMGSTIDTVPAAAFAPSDQCIQIEIQKLKDDYCWTPNPYKETEDGFWETFFESDVIQESYLWFFDPPIHSNTAYIAPDVDYPQEVVVLKPTDVAMQKGASFFSALGRKWWWGWPG